MFHRKWGVSLVASVVLVILGLLPHSRDVQSQGPRFQLEEATIADVHRAIRERQITCRALVLAYVNRARAYNGVSDRLVTRDGAPIPVARGTVRAGSPLKFPTETVAIATLLPNFDQYAGPPIEFGRMEATASDPDVQQQYGIDDDLRARPRGVGASVLSRDPLPADFGGGTAVPGICHDDQEDRIRDRQVLRLGHDGADRLHGGPRRGPDRASEEPKHPFHAAGSGRVVDVQVPLHAVRDAARRGVGCPRVHGDARGCSDAQRPVEILGRGPARGVQELGRDREHSPPARGAAGRRRAAAAAGIVAPRRDESRAGESAGRRRPPACVFASGPNRPGVAARTSGRRPRRNRMGPFAGLTEVLIPAGYVRTVYDPAFALSADRKRYVAINSNTPSTLPVRVCRSRSSSGRSQARRIGFSAWPPLTRRRRRGVCRRPVTQN